MRHHVPNEYRVLPSSRELGPVPGHRCVEVNLAAGRQREDGERSRVLGRRPHVGQRVSLPGRPEVDVRDTGPQIDDELSVEGHCEGRSVVQVVDEVVGEDRPNRFESRIAVAVNRDG